MNQVDHQSTTALVPVPAPEATSTFFFDGKPYDIVVRNGEPWFLAPQLATALGHRSASDLTRLLKDKHKGTHSVRTPGGTQSVTIVSEPGFYQAVLSRKPTARAMPGMVDRIERFQDWVVEEVLPTIRRTGSYVVPQAAPAPATAINVRDPGQLSIIAMQLLQVNEELSTKLEAAAPAVAFHQALADSDGTWGLQAAGKALHQGPNRFIAWLKDRHDLFELNGGNVAKQALIDRGLFAVVWQEFGGKPRPVTKVTGKGIVFYARELGVRPPMAPAQALLPGL